MSDAVTEVAKAAAEALRLAADVQEQKNAPDVKAAEKAQDDVDAVSAETKAVADQNAEAVRKNIAE